MPMFPMRGRRRSGESDTYQRRGAAPKEPNCESQSPYSFPLSNRTKTMMVPAADDLVLSSAPCACAQILGSVNYPQIRGAAYFYSCRGGCMITVRVDGLPHSALATMPQSASMPVPPRITGAADTGFFAFHLHAGGDCDCGGDPANPFPNAGKHYNPGNTPHPYHSGDLPPLLADRGLAYMTVYTDRFTAEEAVGHVLIIHRDYDDFHTQPSGNPGEMIACGRVTWLRGEGK